MLANRIENLAQALAVVNDRAREFAELYAPLEKALLEQQAAARRVVELFESRERAARALSQAYELVKNRASSLKEDALKVANSAPALVGDLAQILRSLAERYAARLF